MHSWGGGELVHELARAIRATPKARRQRGRTAGNRRRGVRLSRNKKGGGEKLPYHPNEPRRERGWREDGGSEDQRRWPSFKGRRRRARLGAREPAREVGELGVSEGGRGEALGLLI
jgi:hypothetical protein